MRDGARVGKAWIQTGPTEKPSRGSCPGYLRPVLIADGHADSLMWNRDLNVASTEGHVDFPRLLEAGVGLQCFTLVTQGFPFIDAFSLFAWWRGWPRAARESEWPRALWQLDQMDRFVAASAGKVAIARTGADLEANLAKGVLSAVLGVEGAHAIEGRLERIAELHARGVRFMSLTHLMNNDLGGSSFPLMGDQPLSHHGHEVLDEMARVGMSVDLAHASPATLRGILEHPTARFFSSHTGVQGAHRGWRNLDDGALRRVAERGGVVGIIFAPPYLGGSELDDVVRHVDHAIGVMGEDGVALGSDFDGMVPLPRGMKDARDLGKIAGALKSKGYAEQRIEKIMGGNFRRFFRETLG